MAAAFFLARKMRKNTPMKRYTPSVSRIAAMLLLSLASACGAGGDDGVGGVSASEADALNAAAARLDAQQGSAETPKTQLNPAATRAATAEKSPH